MPTEHERESRRRGVNCLFSMPCPRGRQNRCVVRARRCALCRSSRFDVSCSASSTARGHGGRIRSDPPARHRYVRPVAGSYSVIASSRRFLSLALDASSRRRADMPRYFSIRRENARPRRTLTATPERQALAPPPNPGQTGPSGFQTRGEQRCRESCSVITQQCACPTAPRSLDKEDVTLANAVSGMNELTEINAACRWARGRG